MRRAGRGGLVRGVARTAVVAGTASAVAGRVHHRQNEKWGNEAAEEQAAVDQQQAAYAQQQQMADQQRQIEELQAQQAQQAYAPPPQQAYAPPPQPQYYAPPPAAPAPAAASGGDSAVLQQLKELAELRSAGILSDEEFAAAKQRVLAGG